MNNTIKSLFALTAAAALLTGCANNNSTSSDVSSDVSVTENSTEPTVENTSTAEPASSTTSGQQPSAEAAHDTSENSPEQTQCTITVEYADDVVLGDHDEYNIGSDELQTLVLFSTNVTVTDFKVLSLFYSDSDENGGFIFDTQTLYTQDTLTPERPLEVGMVFIGDIPNNGISYVDPDGITRTYAVDMSGKDGSLILSEI